jgi:hypothetical protein
MQWGEEFYLLKFARHGLVRTEAWGANIQARQVETAAVDTINACNAAKIRPGKYAPICL